jgi:hypothetical protein
MAEINGMFVLVVLALIGVGIAWLIIKDKPNN